MTGCPVSNQEDGPNRVHSSIPRSKSGNWIYPSPEMFYNAMKKKGYDHGREDAEIIVPIHNMINEQCWVEIMKWEKMHDCKQPMLVSFCGKPKSLSPKARFLHFFGYELPFDRHDWIVDRCGKRVTYILDFYQGTKNENSLMSVHLDVRPKMTLGGFIDRVRMMLKEKIPVLPQI